MLYNFRHLSPLNNPPSVTNYTLTSTFSHDGYITQRFFDFLSVHKIG